MKRIFIILLTLVLLLGICPMSALAETGGSGNVDGGGGDMGQGTSQQHKCEQYHKYPLQKRTSNQIS